jgi:hypothetical protein
MSVSTIKIETDLIALLEVLEKTRNSTVAIQMLDGTYQEPDVCMFNMASSPDKEGNRTEYKYKGYDKWKDEVSYYSEHSYNREMNRETWNALDSWASVLDASCLEAGQGAAAGF